MSYAYANYIDERSESYVITSKQPHNNVLATSFVKNCAAYEENESKKKKENGTHINSSTEQATSSKKLSLIN